MRYKRPFINKAIARLDFSNPIPGFPAELPAILRDQVLDRFAIPEPKEVTQRQIELTQGETIQTDRKEQHVQFHGLEREKSLYFAPSFLWVEYTRYPGFDAMRDDFEMVVRGMGEFFPNHRYSRFGVRFINHVKPDRGESTRLVGAYRRTPALRFHRS